MNINAFSNIKRRARSVFYNIAASKVHKNTIIKFAKKYGLIYFGTVDQQLDEHRVVRGFTVSSTHKDNHYSVGSVDGYDVTVVDRNDAVLKPNGTVVINSWLIMAFDLKTDCDVPHIFINANNHDNSAFESLFSTYPSLSSINLGTFEAYSTEFTNRFTIYSKPTDSIDVEKILRADAARILGTHLWPYSAEVQDGTLYIYCSGEKITLANLNTILANGLWLARNIDSIIESI